MSFGKRYEYHMKSANESPNSVAAQLRDFSFWQIRPVGYSLLFKKQNKDSGIPYQTFINLYLSDCAKQKAADILETKNREPPFSLFLK